MPYQAVVIGVSAGGFDALSLLLPMFSKDFALPVIIVQHRKGQQDEFLSRYLDHKCALSVIESKPNEKIAPGHVYLAPGGYHLLIERDKTFALSIDTPVCHSIPAIDVLFETAAEVYQEKLIGIVLTGANSDGAKGLATIRDYGGLSVVQNPDSAEAQQMPTAAIAHAVLAAATKAMLPMILPPSTIQQWPQLFYH